MAGHRRSYVGKTITMIVSPTYKQRATNLTTPTVLSGVQKRLLTIIQFTAGGCAVAHGRVSQLTVLTHSLKLPQSSQCLLRKRLFLL